MILLDAHRNYSTFVRVSKLLESINGACPVEGNSWRDNCFIYNLILL